MLDKVIHNFRDKMDELESKASDEIDSVIKKINIDNIIRDPQLEMISVVESIMRVLNEDYNHQAIENGVSFAEAIKKRREVKVEDSNNPNLNESQLSVNGKS